jgi:M6 family metalloprotease-like protein
MMLFLFLLGGECNWALIPPTKEQVEKYKQDGTWAKRLEAAKKLGNHRISPALVKQASQRVRDIVNRHPGLVKKGNELLEREPMEPEGNFLMPGTHYGLPSKGNPKILTILISFADHSNIYSQEYIRERLHGSSSDGYPYDTMRNYYLRSSYNQLDVGGNVLGWYKTSYTRGEVAPDDAEMNSETRVKRENLIKEALTYFDNQGHDFAQYDNNGDGFIDYFLVVWTGPNGEWASFWWAFNISFYDSAFQLDGKRFLNYSWQPEKMSSEPSFGLKTIIHETGHSLGLPDYYDYDADRGPDGGVGDIDIMDGKGDHNCFSKFMLGWIDPVLITDSTQALQLKPSGTSQDAALLLNMFNVNNPYTEFFMVQNRYPVGNDTGHSHPGLVIWHVDATLDNYGFAYDNSYTTHKLLRLMEADGLEEIEKGGGYFNSGDFYTDGQEFGPLSFPSNAKYDGTPSVVNVDQIQVNGENVNARLSAKTTVLIGFAAERNEERSWLTKKAYAHLFISLSDTSAFDAGNTVFKICRKSDNGQYSVLHTFNYSDTDYGDTEYFDKYLPFDESFTYLVVAYDNQNRLVGSSVERKIYGD